MTPNDLLDRASQLGLRLEPRGDRLAVVPGSKLPPYFAEMLRQHKPAILALLEAKAENLPPDCAPWLHVAKQILDGEFDGAVRTASSPRNPHKFQSVWANRAWQREIFGGTYAPPHSKLFFRSAGP